MEPVSLILDTDMDTDCDDAGALALVHHAIKLGACRLCAVVCNVPYPEAALCTHYLNRYYSHDDIPVGLAAIPDHEISPIYADYRLLRSNIPEHRRYNKLFARLYRQHGAGSGLPEFHAFTQT